jgi:hypothetical protein
MATIRSTAVAVAAGVAAGVAAADIELRRILLFLCAVLLLFAPQACVTTGGRPASNRDEPGRYGGGGM